MPLLPTRPPTTPIEKQPIVLASNNTGKILELTSLLAKIGLDVIPQTTLKLESVAETGLTFVENALIKARYAAAITGLPAIADDSGLSVDALAGAPGIYSARYAGEGASDKQNINALLHAMKHIAVDLRQAQFNCVLVYLRHAKDPIPLICHGIWQGEIAFEATGDAGFGYDPVFYLPELKRTAAKLSHEQKNSLSHRGKALKQLVRAMSILNE